MMIAAYHAHHFTQANFLEGEFLMSRLHLDGFLSYATFSAQTAQPSRQAGKGMMAFETIIAARSEITPYLVLTVKLMFYVVCMSPSMSLRKAEDVNTHLNEVAMVGRDLRARRKT